MTNHSLAIVIAYAGEAEFLPETMASIFANSGISEIVVGVDTTRTSIDSAESIWAPWILQANEQGLSLVLVHSSERGPAAVRNLAIASTNASLILPVDADDRIAEIYCSEILKIYNSKDPEVGIVYGKAELFGNSSGVWNLPAFTVEGIVLENCIYATSAFRKEDWVAVGGYDTGLIYGQEDWDFWLKIIGLGRKVRFIENVVFHYRIRSGSRSEEFRGMWEQVIWTYDRVCSNNEKLMASQVRTIYHRRIQIELQNATLSGASKGLAIAAIRKYPSLRKFSNLVFVQNLKKKLK